MKMEDHMVRTLPPFVTGKLIALLDLMVDEVEIIEDNSPERNTCDILVQIQWWGEKTPVLIRPTRIKFKKKKNINYCASTATHLFTYHIQTNIELLNLYLRSCEVTELVIIDKIDNEIIGSAFWNNKMPVESFNGSTISLPLVNCLGIIIGELSIRLIFHQFVTHKDSDDLPCLKNNLNEENEKFLHSHQPHQPCNYNSGDNNFIDFNKKHTDILAKVQAQLHNLGLTPDKEHCLKNVPDSDKGKVNFEFTPVIVDKDIEKSNLTTARLQDYLLSDETKETTIKPQKLYNSTRSMTLTKIGNKSEPTPRKKRKNRSTEPSEKTHQKTLSSLPNIDHFYDKRPKEFVNIGPISSRVGEKLEKLVATQSVSSLCKEIIRNAKSDVGIPSRKVKELLKDNNLPKSFNKINKDISDIEVVLLTPPKINTKKCLKNKSRLKSIPEVDLTKVNLSREARSEKIFDYLLGKDMSIEEENQAIEALRSMSSCDNIIVTLTDYFKKDEAHLQRIAHERKLEEINKFCLSNNKKKLAFNLANPIEKTYYETFFGKSVNHDEDFKVAELLNLP